MVVVVCRCGGMNGTRSRGSGSNVNMYLCSSNNYCWSVGFNRSLVRPCLEKLAYIAWTQHFIFNALRMAMSKGIRPVKPIHKKIWCAESPRFFRAKRFSALNLFANWFNALKTCARRHLICFKYDMVSSGNIPEVLNNGLRSDGSIQWMSSTFPHSILMT